MSLKGAMMLEGTLSQGLNLGNSMAISRKAG